MVIKGKVKVVMSVVVMVMNTEGEEQKGGTCLC